MVEIDKGSQIWNYAVYGYEISKDTPALYTPQPLRYKYRRIDLILYYVAGTNPNTKHQFKYDTKKLDYTLKIDRRTNKIVDGVWNHEVAQGGSVDFIWFKDSAGTDTRKVIDLGLVRKMISASRK